MLKRNCLHQTDRRRLLLGLYLPHREYVDEGTDVFTIGDDNIKIFYNSKKAIRHLISFTLIFNTIKLKFTLVTYSSKSLATGVHRTIPICKINIVNVRF